MRQLTAKQHLDFIDNDVALVREDMSHVIQTNIQENSDKWWFKRICIWAGELDQVKSHIENIKLQEDKNGTNKLKLA